MLSDHVWAFCFVYLLPILYLFEFFANRVVYQNLLVIPLVFFNPKTNSEEYYDLAFYYLAPLLNDTLVTSQCVQFTFGDKGDIKLLDESALPVTEKEIMRKWALALGWNMDTQTLNQQYSTIRIPD